jgi:hypothetical protein
LKLVTSIHETPKTYRNGTENTPDVFFFLTLLNIKLIGRSGRYSRARNLIHSMERVNIIYTGKTTLSGAHPASYTMDTRGSFPGGIAAGA